jgi:1-acyl-sn-glycerol-3-phosphate acyltransferase
MSDFEDSSCVDSSAVHASTPFRSLPPKATALTLDMTVPEAVSALVTEPHFRKLVRFFTGADASRTLDSANDARTEFDFQSTLGLRLLTALLARTARHVEVQGAEHLGSAPACLYISNHRDILLDSALLNRTLIAEGQTLPQVVIGSNLLKTPWLRPVFRLSRCIVVQRDLKGKALYEHSRRLSAYVRQSLSGEDSVWIAQRQGRTKDGEDRTEPALLRMLLMAYERAPVEQERELHVTPVAVSYEMEPCDVFKAASMIGANTRNRSESKARRDLSDILRGLMQPKGQIRLTIRPPVVLNHREAAARSKDRAEVIADLAQTVDHEIQRGYALWPTNYAAYDRLHDTSAHSGFYSSDDRAAFGEYVERRAAEIEANPKDAIEALLTLYARPVAARVSARLRAH